MSQLLPLNLRALIQLSSFAIPATSHPAIKVILFSLHASWLRIKLSSRRHYGNMDAEDGPAPGLQVQQPPAVFAGGNVVDANGQNILFNGNPAPFAVHQPRPSCFSRCCSVCGVIIFVSLTAVFSLIAASMGSLLEFSAGITTSRCYETLCVSLYYEAPVWTVRYTLKGTAPLQQFKLKPTVSCT
jgi:hypothetical protein